MHHQRSQNRMKRLKSIQPGLREDQRSMQFQNRQLKKEISRPVLTTHSFCAPSNWAPKKPNPDSEARTLSVSVKLKMNHPVENPAWWDWSIWKKAVKRSYLNSMWWNKRLTKQKSLFFANLRNSAKNTDGSRIGCFHALWNASIQHERGYQRMGLHSHTR